MLDREEIVRIAKIKRLSVKNTEKDYLLEMLLFLLSNEVGKKLVFKGGTALYKLHSLNRFSEDLDFTLDSHRIEVKGLFTKIIRRLKDVGINSRIKEISDYRNQKNVRLELRGPLFDGNPKQMSLITVNVSLRERPIYKAEQRKIFSQYPDIAAFDVFVMPLNELLAEKIRALLTRDKARDVYDTWFLFNKGAEFIPRDVNKKLKKYEISFSAKDFISKVDEKENSWYSDLEGLILGTLPDFNTVRSDLLRKILKNDKYLYWNGK